MEMMLSSLGNNIRSFRMEAGLSQEQLSSLCGMDRAQLSKIEKVTVVGVTFNTIAKIYDALGMKLVPVKENVITSLKMIILVNLHVLEKKKKW